MKTVLKWVLRIVGLVVILFGGFVLLKVVQWRPTYPDVAKPAIEASDDPAVIARGEYLVHSVMHCAACHTPAQTYTGSAPGEKLALVGGHEWHMGPLGTIRSTNITPDEETGIGKYTDAELARAIRHGVGKDDRGLLFMMSVGGHSDEDLTAVISYLRTTEPVKNEVPESEVGVMGKVLFQTAMAFFAAPHDYSDMTPPFVKEGETSIERGKYLAEGPAFCNGCHTQIEADGAQIKIVEPKFAGRRDPDFPDETEEGYTFYAPNLTQHATGIINGWSKDQFITRVRNGRVYAGSPMPWESYRNMTDADLESIYMYLTSLEPADNDIGPTRAKKG